MNLLQGSTVSSVISLIYPNSDSLMISTINVIGIGLGYLKSEQSENKLFIETS